MSQYLTTLMIYKRALLLHGNDQNKITGTGANTNYMLQVSRHRKHHSNLPIHKHRQKKELKLF